MRAPFELPSIFMQISFRALITALHGMGFGALFLLAFSGALIELYRICTPGRPALPDHRERRFLTCYLIAMVILAWGAVLSGAYLVYPWYRAIPPAGITDYAGFPQRLLLSNPNTSGWHSLGMEWKEHVAWFAPIAITMVAYVFIKYASDFSRHREVRKAILTFCAVAFIAAAIAGGLGAFLNKYAPVQGGAEIILMKGTK
jgi:hypothetical protein